jgi:peptidoglycan hydrolase CwlO-like protein
MKNSVSRWACCLVATIVVAGVMAPAAFADADKDAKKESRRLQAQLSAAQKEKGVLATQVEELKKQLGDIGSKSEVLEKKSGSQRKQLTEMTEKYQEADKNLQEMLQLYADTHKSLQELQTEKEQERKRLSGDILVCEKKNSELYQISAGLMEKYRSKGIISSLLMAEPFTQLERVKVQNVLQEYGDKAETARIAEISVVASLPAKSAPAGAPASNVPVAANGLSSTATTGAIASETPVQVSNIPPAHDATGSAGNAPVVQSSK